MDVSSQTRPDAPLTTTVLVHDLHCASCVHTIEDALSTLSPVPKDIQVSIVSKSISVQHSPDLSPSLIYNTIGDAGFNVLSNASPVTQQISLNRKLKHFEQCNQCRDSDQGYILPTESESQHASSDTPHRDIQHGKRSPSLSHSKGIQPTLTPEGGRHLLTVSIGGMTCPSCSKTITEVVSKIHGVSDVSVSFLGKFAIAVLVDPELAGVVVNAIENAGYEAAVTSIESQKKSDVEVGPYRMTLTIGGMICSSCVDSITRMVSDLDGVSEIVVSLLNNTATVIITEKNLAEAVLEKISDCGFEAELVSVQAIGSAKENDDLGSRTVSLKIDGMFCNLCPPRVMKAIDSFDQDIHVLRPVTSSSDSILEISYTPGPPNFTVRTIIDAIKQSKSPPFTVSLYKSPSVEELAKCMRAHEQQALYLRLLAAFIVAIPTFIIGIVFMTLMKKDDPIRMYFMQPLWAGNVSRGEWALFIMATPVMFYSANMFHRMALKEIRALWKRGSTTPILKRFIRFGSMNLLVSSGVSVAYFASIVLLVLAAMQTPAPDGIGDSTTFFDSVVFLTLFLLAGRCLEAYSKLRTADAITALSTLRPTSALLITPTAGSTKENLTQYNDVEKDVSDKEIELRRTQAGYTVEKIDATLLEVGDIVRVGTGASPPADGTIVEGEEGAFDESSLTGESRLIKKAVGDKVFMGTINKSKMVDVRVGTRVGGTMLDSIVRLVREGQTRRAPIERVADLLTGYFVPVVTALAIIVWLTWVSLGFGGRLPRDYLDIPIGGWTVWSLQFAIAVFVIACPCGIGLAAPTALLVGSGLAAKHGILARGGGEAFQEMAQVDVVVFDKTGTLTEGGEPRVTDHAVFPTMGRLEEADVFGIASELESGSSHPLGIAIRQFCHAHGASSLRGSIFEEHAGRGVKAQFEDLQVTGIIGNEAWMEEHGVMWDGVAKEKLEAWKAEAKSVILLGIRDASTSSFLLAAIFAVSDQLRPEAPSVITWLHRRGIGTWMISGDNLTTAESVARIAGIAETNVIAGVLPHEKADKIRWLQEVGKKRPLPKWRRFFGKTRLNERCLVAMVGDGINDAPALTAADIGVAIGSGSDIAISSASFILLSSNLKSLLTLIDLAQTVFRRVKFNFLYAAMYNIVAIPIAAGVIYPAGHARLAPVWASLAMALSSVTVVCSSLLLRLYREPKL